jgi:hypothetical protein
LHNLLEIGDRRRSSHELSPDVCELLVRGWQKRPELKDACFDGLSKPGPDGGLGPDIAMRVLLSAFPRDPDVVRWAVDQLRTNRFPFLSFGLGFDAYKLLAANFRDVPELVAAIDEWGPSQQFHEPEVSYAALVGRTAVMKQKLVRNLESSVPFWAARSLLDGWGAEDPEVRRELLKLALGSGDVAAGIAEYISKILDDPDHAHQRLWEILIDPNTRFNHHHVLAALSGMELSPGQKEEIAKFSIGLRNRIPYIHADTFDSIIITGFRDVQEVREFAKRALTEREPPVAAVASAYSDDAEMRSAVTTLISPLPDALRSQILSHLAKGDDDQFALKLLADYDKEHDRLLKSQASVAYHKLLLRAAADLAPATAYLADTIITGGVDMEERRQAALAGLAVLDRLDIMITKAETLGKSRAVSFTLSSLGERNLPLARSLADNWARNGEVFSGQLSRMLDWSKEPTAVWDALALAAIDIPAIQREVLERLDHEESFSVTPGPLSLLAHFKPRSELLRRRCVSAIVNYREPPYRFDSVLHSISILEEHFEDRRAIAAEIFEGQRPSRAVLLALAALDPDHPVVAEAYKAIKAGYPGATVAEYFALEYACVPAEDIIGVLWVDTEERDIVDRYSHDQLSGPVIRRIKRDPRARAAFISALDGNYSSGFKTNILRLLGAAGLVTPALSARCLAEANSLIRAGMVECATDVLSGLARAIPLSLLDIADRAEQTRLQ